MIQKYLRIMSIGQLEQGKNGKYRVVTFEPKYMLQDGTPIASALSQGVRTVFGSSKIGDKEVSADGLFKGIENKSVGVGSLVEGHIARVTTTPYTFPGRDKPTSQWTGVIFGHENARDYVNKSFANAGTPACVIEGDNMTAPENMAVATNAGSFKPMEV